MDRTSTIATISGTTRSIIHTSATVQYSYQLAQDLGGTMVSIDGTMDSTDGIDGIVDGTMVLTDGTVDGTTDSLSETHITLGEVGETPLILTAHRGSTTDLEIIDSIIQQLRLRIQRERTTALEEMDQVLLLRMEGQNLQDLEEQKMVL